MNNRHPNSAASTQTIDNMVRVSTPENISFQYEITGPMRRALAYLADVCITVSVFAIVAIVIFLLILLAVGSFAASPFGGLATAFGNMGFALVCVLAFVTLWFYGAYMETNYNGQTFGKMIANIRTISTDGSAIDGTQATLRNLFRLLDVFPTVSLGLFFGHELGYFAFLPIFAFGFISMIISPRFQRIGDFVAGTMVVTEDKKWVHGLAKFQDPRVADLADLLPDSYVTPPSMARALAEFVDRRRVLPAQRVNEIASHLARPLLEKFDLPRDTNPDLLLCSLYYKTFIDKQENHSNSISAIERLANQEQSNNPYTAVVTGDSR